MKSLIIDSWALQQKVIRLAHEILEDQFEEEEVCLIGIAEGGFQTAELLQQEIQKVKTYKVSIHRLQIKKDLAHESPVKIDTDLQYFENKAIIIVDDVANSGRTLFYSFKPFMNLPLKCMKVAVLVDRKHKKFPVHCDYVGTSLATTIKEHIEVVFEEKTLKAAYLL